MYAEYIYICLDIPEISWHILFVFIWWQKPRQILILETERTLMWLQAIVSGVRLELVVDTNWYLLIWVKIFNNFIDPVSWWSPSYWPKGKSIGEGESGVRGRGLWVFTSISLWKFGQIVGKLKSFERKDIRNKDRKEINKDPSIYIQLWKIMDIKFSL